MPARANANGVMYSEPILTTDRDEDEIIERNGGSHVPAPAVATEGVEFDWNGWLNAWLDNEREAMIPFYKKMLRKLGDELLDLIEPRLKKIDALELRLAEARGAIDVLRGRGAPGAFRVRGTFDGATTYSYLDVVMHGGSSWVATRDRPGELPGSGWPCWRREAWPAR
jgi:hypothetical protein